MKTPEKHVSKKQLKASNVKKNNTLSSNKIDIDKLVDNIDIDNMSYSHLKIAFRMLLRNFQKTCKQSKFYDSEYSKKYEF